MFILLPILIIISSISTVYLLYCKTRNLKRQESQVNNVTRPRRMDARPSVPSIYVVPTTNQVMTMYVNHSINNVGQPRNTAAAEQCKPPPDYGQVVVEIPPSYEEAIVQAGRNEAY